MAKALPTYFYIYKHVTKGGIRVCLYIGETNFAFAWTLYSAECHRRSFLRGSDTSACPRVWLGPVGALWQALEARKNLVRRIRIRKRMRIWKSENRVTATTTLFPHANSRSHLGTLSHFAPWNKPIHGLELFQFTAVLPVLPTYANTLDRSRHFWNRDIPKCTSLSWRLIMLLTCMVNAGMPYKFNHHEHACFARNYPEALLHCGHGHDLTSFSQLSVINIADIRSAFDKTQASERFRRNAVEGTL